MGSSSNGYSFFGLVFAMVLATASASNFYQDFDITWGDHRAKIFNGGQLLSLSLDKTSGSGFQSKKEYLFGRIEYATQACCWMKLEIEVIFVMQLSSQGPTHDEIDFEFLGNLSGDPYILHTKCIHSRKGNREQQFYLWFDPTRNFHTYSIAWSAQHIMYFLGGQRSHKAIQECRINGGPFPKNQPMRIYSSLWNADDWATRGGLVKTDWSKAPFTAYYRNFRASTSTSTSTFSDSAFQTQELDAYSRRRLRWVQKNFMIYNYCTDLKRFPQGVPPECKHSRFNL
ncbi:Xyloglucan endotransglucosylase/hydrolase 2 [Vitis vinifera]|uniref:Xyloglucan endotransglucosylase/hydrolase n=1 Tax=Vitis vinifera TaxID=29760 RepID=A0A438G5F0_VITVI|nr:Xyloglucan endotransglucosylase/hydrolase 2 [Vitis vinifera]